MTDVSTTKRKNLTREELIAHFTYNEEKGIFQRAFTKGKWKKGHVAGHKDSNGHIQLTINGKLYLAHRCAWLWFYGEWPVHDIDHVNGNRSDNRLINLRIATRSQNCCNSKKRKDNTTGLKGVSIQKGKYRAQIQIGKLKHHIGMFSTPEEAHAAYCAAAAVLHGEFARIA